jgi:hypothetical protein
MARHMLREHDISGLTVIEGGIEAFARAGGKVQQGTKVMSLERQVRIGAGLLVLLSAILGVVVHPWFLALGAFVGVGLIFAGVTDRCGMTLVLAKAPWNKGSTGAMAAGGGGCAASVPSACAASAPSACAASAPVKAPKRKDT